MLFKILGMNLQNFDRLFYLQTNTPDDESLFYKIYFILLILSGDCNFLFPGLT